eukprot:CAMPEP_0195512890 /NCGR_PEP_ID=MMETSP0794_2-20130614/4684_1 /TAXON_ID=515487 /ORGANISM="Stephanopyxis turris, Strain CCMP 815" /LENGTH=624 /DNA_ID=CAMNT_0040640771 /DNA_START=74 /DNA_END=1948 /DNA_ORIENTATION=+
MGACQGKGKSSGDDFDPDQQVMDELNNSIHDPTKTTRQKMAWHRNMDISEVYEVLEIVGQGSMGEVCIVKKRSDLAESSSRASLSDMQTNGSSEGGGNGNNRRSSQTARKYACKTVNTVRMKSTEIKEFINEIDILRDLDHPNTVQLFETFAVKRKIWIVTDLCSGGDLGTRIRKVNMTETDSVLVVEQILRAIAYMHKRNVCHRDIKLENIMYSDDSPDALVKLIDFGLSNKFAKGEKMLKACGTAYTAAPEILSGQGITEQSDIWSIGVVTFILLSNEYPFITDLKDLENESKKFKLEEARYVFSSAWKKRGVSEHGKEFVANCLKKHPGERWDAVDALDFVQKVWIPFLVEEGQEKKKKLLSAAETEKTKVEGEGQVEVVTSLAAEGADKQTNLDKEMRETEQQQQKLERSIAVMRKRTKMKSHMLEGMKTYALYGEMKKRILMTIAYTMDKGDLKELSHIFNVMDSNSSGTITLMDLKSALHEMQAKNHLEEATLEKLFKDIDIDNSGEIHYAEFLAAVSESQGLVTQERLADAFDRLDSEGKGYINKEDLKRILGSDYNEDLVHKMLEECDSNKNGNIDYDEFLRLMFDKDPKKGMETTVGSTRNLYLDESMVEKMGVL